MFIRFYFFFHAKSPLNHHLGEHVLELFPGILSKSKWCLENMYMYDN